MDCKHAWDHSDKGLGIKRLRVPGGWLYILTREKYDHNQARFVKDGEHPPVFVPDIPVP